MGSPASLTLGTPTVGATEYLHALQEEKRKIEAFKRELPVCMHLIDQAIENARQRATDDQKRSTPPLLENFMPLKRRWEKTKAEEVGEEEVEEKMVVVGRPAWMGEAHLWTQQQQKHHVHQDTQGGARSSSTSSRLLLSSKHRQGGAFVPFNRDSSRQQLSSSPPPNSSTPEAAAAAAAAAPAHTNGDNTFDTVESVDANRHEQVSSDRQAQRMSVSGAAQPPRKARRCWSPELHRRFVNALQQLGGSQVATPKQIRELMKVDGLTNDEVKSHLQKYRLHTRRPSPSPASSPPPMVILGWVPPECTLSQPAAAPPHHVLQDQYKSTAASVQQQQQPPKKQHSPPSHQHLSPASQTSSLHGPSPGRHSSTDSYLDDEGTDSEVGQEQELKCRSTSSSQEEHQEMSDGSEAEHLKREYTMSSVVTKKAAKLQTLRKVTRAAA